MPKKKFGIKLAILIVLILPLGGILITKYVSDTNLKMPPHYVVDRILKIPDEDGNITTDTVYHRVRPFALVNQLGDTIRLKDIDGSLAIVNFFQADDSAISKPVSRTLEKLAKSFAQSDTGLHVLSISTNPQADSVPALLDYAFAHHADHSVWWFLRGPADSVKSMAENDFNITLKPHGTNNALSSPTLILLDRFQHVRGYYNALDSADIRKCVHDLSLLMIEKEKLNGIQR